MNGKLLRLLRPKQWVKNIFVLVPLIFSRTFTEPGRVLRALGAFLCFTAVSSAIYVLNDIIDIEKDRLHETKRFRPLASGEVTKGQAFILMALLLVLGLAVAFAISTNVVLCLTTYIVLNILYSLFFKKIVILDITVIAIGFVLRVITGAAAINVYISSWVLLCSFLLPSALLRGKGKPKRQAFRNPRPNTGKFWRFIPTNF